MKLSEWDTSSTQIRGPLDKILDVNFTTKQILRFDDLVVLALYGRSRPVPHPVKQPPKSLSLTPNPLSHTLQTILQTEWIKAAREQFFLYEDPGKLLLKSKNACDMASESNSFWRNNVALW